MAEKLGNGLQNRLHRCNSGPGLQSRLIELRKMEKILNIVQIVSAILLIILILLQQRGATLGGAFGGESAVYSARRGVEKILFILTIIIAIIFLVAAILNVLK